MKGVLFVLVFIVLFSNVVNGANIIWKEDFEDGNLLDSFPSAGSSAVTTSHLPRTGINSLRFDSCLYSVDPITEVQGNPLVDLSYGGDGSAFNSSVNTSREVYVKYWARYEPDNDPVYSHITENFLDFGTWDPFRNTGFIGFVANRNTIFGSPLTTRVSLGTTFSFYNNPLPSYFVYDGNWHKFEFYANYNTGVIRSWVDNTLVLDQSRIVYGSPNKVRLKYFANLTSRYTYCTSSPVQIDDFEVWDGLPNTNLCVNGQITSECQCANSTRTNGYCLNNVWNTTSVNVCSPQLEACNDEKDNDCDNLVDCYDSDCYGLAGCNPECTSANVKIAAQESYVLYFNGKYIGYNETPLQVKLYNVSLLEGNNVIAVNAFSNFTMTPAFIAEINYCGNTILTDGTWKITGDKPYGWNNRTYDSSSWNNSILVALTPPVGINSGAQWIWTPIPTSVQNSSDIGWFRKDFNVNTLASPGCQLTNAYWNTTQVNEGIQVRLTVVGTNCDGQAVSFNILEEDDLIVTKDYDSVVLTNPPTNSVFSSGVATQTWITEWVNDSDGSDFDPEYLFNASLISNLSNHLESSNVLKVIGPICGNTILETGEQCDDGNTIGADGCSATCQLECGDGICQAWETCLSCTIDCGECPVCTLNSATWNGLSQIQTVTEGANVNLVVSGTNCNGETVRFSIFEADSSTADDLITPINPPANAVFVNNQAITSWVSEWYNDTDYPPYWDPEYIFTATLLSNSSKNVSVNENYRLNVLKAAVTCVDGDGDGYNSTTYSCGPVDCNDSNSSVWQNLTGYPDNDSDGYYSLISQEVCSGLSLPAGYSLTQGTDCNDNDGMIYINITLYRDADHDIYGVSPAIENYCYGSALSLTIYMAQNSLSSNTNDCNDNNADINPGASESCNGIDDNCDYITDEITRNCGEGVCQGNQTCYFGTWGDCNSEGDDAGVCAICSETGTISYDPAQNLDCNDGISCTVDICSNIGACSYDSSSCSCLTNSDCSNSTLIGNPFCVQSDVYTETTIITRYCNAQFICQDNLTIINQNLYQNCSINNQICSAGSCNFEQLIQNISLIQGWNLVTQRVNSTQNSSIFNSLFVMRYQDGQWELDTGLFGDDSFELEPLRGYYVYSTSNKIVSIPGIVLNSGYSYQLRDYSWNLFAVNRTGSFDNLYLNFSLIQQEVGRLSSGFVYNTLDAGSSVLVPGEFYWVNVRSPDTSPPGSYSSGLKVLLGFLFRNF